MLTFAALLLLLALMGFAIAVWFDAVRVRREIREARERMERLTERLRGEGEGQ